MNRDEWRDPNLAGAAVLAVAVVAVWLFLIAWFIQRWSS